MSDWNPELYLKFEKERTQPVNDLISRIEIKYPKRILDIGCGPGNSTAALKKRWPDAEIIGIDLSEAMIEKAKKDYPDIRFEVSDAAGDLSGLGSFDIVFSNAALQWMPSHEKLISRLLEMVRAGGAFAAQIPKYDIMPIASLIDNVALSPDWKQYFADFKTGFEFHPDECYYDFLSSKSSEISLWATKYYHVMCSHENIIEMISSTGIKPYIERLPEEKHSEFLSEVLENLKTTYPSQIDGRVLFPFERFFVIAYRPKTA